MHAHPRRRYARHFFTLSILFLELALTAGVMGNGRIVDTGTNFTYIEDFESIPSGFQGNTYEPWLVASSTGTGVQQAWATALIEGNRAWRVTDNAAAYAAQLYNTGASVDSCGSSETLRWSWALEGGTGSTQNFDLRVSGAAVVGTAQPANTFGLIVTGALGAETLTPYVRGTSGAATMGSAFAGGYTAPGVVTVIVSSVNCVGGASATFTLSGAVSGTQTVTSAGSFTGPLNRLNVASTGTSASGTSVDVDNIQWTNVPYPAPTVSSIVPNTGPTSGASAFDITGTNFKAGATVSFGGFAASISSVTSTDIKGLTPTHAAGSVPVTVSNVDGQSAAPAQYTFIAGTADGDSTCGGEVTEAFESYPLGTSPPTRCWYVWQTTDAGNQAVPNPSPLTGRVTVACCSSGDQDLFFDHTRSSSTMVAGRYVFHFDDCARSTGAVNKHVSWDFALAGLPVGTSEYDMGMETTGGSGVTESTGPNNFQQDHASIGIARQGLFAGVEVNSAGAMSLRWKDGNKNTFTSSLSPGVTVATNRVYNVDLVLDCFSESAGTNTPSYTVTVLDTSTQVSSTGSSGLFAGTPETNTVNGLYFGCTSGTVSACSLPMDFFMDNIHVNAIPPRLNKHVAPVTGLTGFDVDKFGLTVVARENGAARVSTFDAQTLGAPLATKAYNHSGDCSATSVQTDGVATLWNPDRVSEYVTYEDCYSPGPTYDLHIRNAALNMPNLGDGCSKGDSTDFCSTDCQTDTDTVFGPNCGPQINVPQSIRQIGFVQNAKWDWSRFGEGTPGEEGCTVQRANDGIGCPKHITLCWGFAASTQGTGLGLYCITQNNKNPDRQNVVYGTIGANSPLDFCSWHTPDAQDHMAGSESGSNTKTYNAKVDVSLDPGGPGSNQGATTSSYDPHPKLSLLTQSSTPFTHAIGLSCPNPNGNENDTEVAIVTNEGAAYVYDMIGPHENRVVFGPVTTGGASYVRGVAVTAYLGSTNDGRHNQFLAVERDDGTHLYNVVTGAALQPVIPKYDNCAFKTIRLDDTAQHLWWVSACNIVVYETSVVTTVQPLPPGARTGDACGAAADPTQPCHVDPNTGCYTSDDAAQAAGAANPVICDPTRPGGAQGTAPGGTNEGIPGSTTKRNVMTGQGLIFTFSGMDQPDEITCLIGGWTVLIVFIGLAIAISFAARKFMLYLMLTFVFLGQAVAYIFWCFNLWIIFGEIAFAIAIIVFGARRSSA